jgi:hypothetical protein
MNYPKVTPEGHAVGAIAVVLTSESLGEVKVSYPEAAVGSLCTVSLRYF